MGALLDKIFGGDPLKAPSEACAQSVHDCSKYVLNDSECRSSCLCVKCDCNTDAVSETSDT